MKLSLPSMSSRWKTWFGPIKSCLSYHERFHFPLASTNERTVWLMKKKAPRGWVMSPYHVDNPLLTAPKLMVLTSATQKLASPVVVSGIWRRKSRIYLCFHNVWTIMRHISLTFMQLMDYTCMWSKCVLFLAVQNSSIGDLASWDKIPTLANFFLGLS